MWFRWSETKYWIMLKLTSMFVYIASRYLTLNIMKKKTNVYGGGGGDDDGSMVSKNWAYWTSWTSINVTNKRNNRNISHLIPRRRMVCVCVCSLFSFRFSLEVLAKYPMNVLIIKNATQNVRATKKLYEVEDIVWWVRWLIYTIEQCVNDTFCSEFASYISFIFLSLSLSRAFFCAFIFHFALFVFCVCASFGWIGKKRISATTHTHTKMVRLDKQWRLDWWFPSVGLHFDHADRVSFNLLMLLLVFCLFWQTQRIRRIHDPYLEHIDYAKRITL